MTDSSINTIREQADRILASGVLGRSRSYAKLLEYLVACAGEGRSPKELEIATQVFGRGSDFDPSQDSLVRVYAHNLRRKLQRFYTEEGRDERLQLAIPTGEYRIAVADRMAETAHAPGSMPALGRWRTVTVAAAAAVLVAVGIAVGMIIQDRSAAVAPISPLAEISKTPLWRTLFDDDLPILVVVGDYFIFGERDEQGHVERLVREFSINSSEDFDDLAMEEPGFANRYVDLDLTYLPRSSASALRDVLRVIFASQKTARIVSMSELSVAELKSGHIVYIGYISALDKLLDFAFASSGLNVGLTFDELVEKSTGEVFASEAGVPAGFRNYRDYGLYSTFPGPTGNQFFIVAGTRDAGLMHTAQVLADPMQLRVAEQAARDAGFDSNQAVELLFEVTGFGRTNLDAMIVHSAPLDYARIWGGELVQGD